MSRPPSSSSSASVDRRRLWRDWEVLCRDIGERRAGTPEERLAAAFVARRLAAAGLGAVEVLDFPCLSHRSSCVDLAAHERGRWRPADARILAGAPGCAAGERELVWLEMPEESARLAPGSLRGRVAVVFGPLPTSARDHRRLVAAAPDAVIHVDERLPFAWTKSDGVYPEWVRRYGMPTTVAMAYLDAWRWRMAGVNRVRLAATAQLEPALSPTVSALLPGRDSTLPEILVLAHHDTQAGNVGADDNASGVVALLEIARLLARRGRRMRRGVRFLSFGAEEQLSVGAAAYVRAHLEDRNRWGLVVNLDSVASPLGHWEMYSVGGRALVRHAQATLARHGLSVAPKSEVTPFGDIFPFNWSGVPSLWFFRTNTPGARWQHHSPSDSLENVSVEAVARLVGALVPMVGDLAEAARWPFGESLPMAQRRTIARLGQELFGLPRRGPRAGGGAGRRSS
jgi:hypothetical protein